MRNLGAWIVLWGVAVWGLGCGGSAPAATDGPGQRDAGGDAGVDAGSGGDSGTGDDGGVPDGGCESDPACTAAGPRCDPAGTDLLGECVDVGGGCLELKDLAACLSTLQTCPVGAAACACPTTSCNTEVDTACGTDGTVVSCRLDVAGGCGVYPESGGQACPGHQSCHGSPPTAACACDDSDCTGAGQLCSSDASAVLVCQLDGACPYVASSTPCASPKVCQGSFPGAACACPPATGDTRAGRGCATLGVNACDLDTGNINQCVLDSVSGCQLWRLAAGTTCTAQQLVCGTDSGVPACQCPANTTGVFYADAFNGSPAGGMPFPSGVLTPSQCRFKLLTPALAAAQTWVMSHPSAEVRATGQVSISVMHFAEPAYPLVVPPDVTLTTTDSPLDPSHYVIDFAQPAATAVVQLGSNAALKGFTIQNLVSAATSADGVVTSPGCADGTAVTLETIRIAGEATPNRLRHGVVIAGAPAGSCDATLTDVAVRSVSQAGLLVQSTLTAATTRVVDSLFDGNGNGVRALRGTVELDSVSVTNSGAEGILVQPTGGDAVVSGVAGDVTGSQREGVAVEIGTGATTASLLSLTGTVISDNGANSGGFARFPGIAILARSARLVGVNVHDNAGGGLRAVGAGTVVAVDLDAGNAAHFDSNGPGALNPPAGVLVGDGASVTATGMTANANDGPGAYVDGGASSLTLHGCQIDSNGVVGNAPGLEVLGGTVVVDGASVISNNRGEGLRQYAGTVSLNGSNLVGVVVRNNGQAGTYSGARIGQGQTDTAFTANYADFRDNTEHGVYVFNRNLQNQGGPINIVNCTFVDNARVGLQVATSMPSPTGARTLTVSGTSFTGGTRGIWLEAAGGDIQGSVQGNSITKAANTGLVLHGTAASSLTIARNQITGNSSLFMPPGRAAGGVLIDGVPPNPFAFFGNSVHHNDYDQVMVVGANPIAVTWNLAGASCAPSEYNTFACYNGQMPAGAYFGLVVVGAVTVNASNESWQSHSMPPPPPVAGIDYLLQGAGAAVTITASCADSTLACP
ncbi:MAG: right-handed parallel beta-helix repeat-containing protein [Deltaproteobacteria bacterium]|nr:right-handed parallel beta-helix repeat-containing protein [Deltaproteobacteria bacterium]